MGATLDALHRLQATENQLRSIRGRIESKMRQVNARQRRVTSLDEQINNTQEQVRQAQAQADKLELERKVYESHISKLRENLNQAKTNKAYAAALTELNTDKADALKLEDQVLAALTRVDEHQQQVAKLLKKREKEQDQLNEFKTKAEQLKTELSGQIKDLEEQRADATSEIPPATLANFERACTRHDGEAMAIIEKTHPRRAEYVCTGCNMSVTLETISALQAQNEVQQCQTCSRILYLDAPAEVPT